MVRGRGQAEAAALVAGRVALAVVAAVVLAGLTGLRTGSAAGAPPGIVTRQGSQLQLDGRPWQFVGYNNYRLTSWTYSEYTCGGAHTDAAVDATLQHMHDASGATVVRTWFYQSFVATGDWHGFDRLLASAAKYGMKVIPVLADQWGACETFDGHSAQYKTLGWYQGGYRSSTYNGLPLTYAQYVARVAARYRGDPRIAFWQLMNEAEALDAGPGSRCEESAAETALRSFADDMTASVKAVDPAHLVSLGTIGGGQCGIAGSDYVKVHSGLVDMCEGHDYSLQPAPLEQTNPCTGIAKPHFTGERGFLADLGTGAVTTGTLTTRAGYFDQEMRGTFGSAMSGYLVWEQSSTSASYGVGAGDPTEAVMLRISGTLSGVVSAAPAPAPSPASNTTALSSPVASGTPTRATATSAAAVRSSPASATQAAAVGAAAAGQAPAARAPDTSSVAVLEALLRASAQEAFRLAAGAVPPGRGTPVAAAPGS